MNMYLYAPKDDVKHRAYWRDLYTVEEAGKLVLLYAITCNNQNYYSLDPTEAFCLNIQRA